MRPYVNIGEQAELTPRMGAYEVNLVDEVTPVRASWPLWRGERLLSKRSLTSRSRGFTPTTAANTSTTCRAAFTKSRPRRSWSRARRLGGADARSLGVPFPRARAPRSSSGPQVTRRGGTRLRGSQRSPRSIECVVPGLAMEREIEDVVLIRSPRTGRGRNPQRSSRPRPRASCTSPRSLRSAR